MSTKINYKRRNGTMKGYQVIMGDGTSFVIYGPDDVQDPLEIDSLVYVDKDSVVAIISLDKALKYEREWKNKNADLVMDLQSTDRKHQLIGEVEAQTQAKKFLDQEHQLVTPRS
jgi:hypothetical protein